MLRIWFEWTLAVRLLREGRTQTGLIIGGIALGVAVIVFLTALISGLQVNIIERTLGTQAHIKISAPDDVARPLRSTDDTALAVQIERRAQRLRSVDQWPKIQALLDAVPEITAVSPVVSGPALARRGAASRSVAMTGIDPARYTQIVPLDQNIREGRFRLTGREILIGTQLAQDLGAGVGERIRLETGDGRSDVFTVVGIFELGVRDLDQRLVFLPMKPAQALLDLPGGATGIDLRVREIFEAEAVAQRISRRYDIKAESWMVTNSNILDALRAQSTSTNLIKVFVAISVAFGIASVLAVSVVQRAREIGILRAMGTTSPQILKVFLLQGALVGLIGAAIGSVLASGLIALWVQLGLSRSSRGGFDLMITPELFIGATALATVVGMIAAVAPARRAAKLDPVEAMRAI